MYKFGHLQYLLLFSEFNQPRIFFADFEISSNIKLKKKCLQRQPSCSMRTDRPF